MLSGTFLWNYEWKLQIDIQAVSQAVNAGVPVNRSRVSCHKV